MNLKESFRLQNKIESFINECRSYLYSQSNVTQVKETHNRKKSNPEADNEELVVEKNSTYNLKITPNDIIKFAMYLIEVKKELSNTISLTKNMVCAINIDDGVALNKRRQDLIFLFNNLSNMKSNETTTQGRDYKFNVAGDQVPYTYEVKKVTTIDFDRSLVKSFIKKLSLECDEVSNSIDSEMINCKVNFEINIDVNDTFEDVLDKFMNNKLS